jgi:hypothetical protein
MKLSLLLLAFGSLMAAASSVLPNEDSQLTGPLKVSLQMAGNHEVLMSTTNVGPEAVKVLIVNSPLNGLDTQNLSVESGLLRRQASSPEPTFKSSSPSTLLIPR